jgi:hypothetical protein
VLTSDIPASGPTAGEHTSAARNGDREFAQLKRLVGERIDTILAATRTLWAVRTDKAQLAIRRRAQLAAGLAFAALAGGTVTIYAAILVVAGVAGGFAALFEQRAWLGNLLAGVLLLAAAGVGLLLAMRRSDRKALQKAKLKYERLRAHRDDVA